MYTCIRAIHWYGNKRPQADTRQSFTQGGGGEAPSEVQPLTLIYTIFDGKGKIPFYPFYPQMVSLSHT